MLAYYDWRPSSSSHGPCVLMCINSYFFLYAEKREGGKGGTQQYQEQCSHHRTIPSWKMENALQSDVGPVMEAWEDSFTQICQRVLIILFPGL